MRKNYDENNIIDFIKKYNINQYFDNVDLPFYIIEYEKGEFLQQPSDKNNLFQIGISGEINIYHISMDGEKYFLSHNKNSFKLGCIEFSIDNEFNVYAEALTNVTVIALSLDECRSFLSKDNKFLNMVAYEMAQIITQSMNYRVVPSSLSERVVNYMKYYCPDNILKGVEKTAFKLHCSDRQLQRILNDLESKNIIQKCGKGTYRLLLIN